MADENRNEPHDVQAPPMVKLQSEIVELENQLRISLRRLESKWRLHVLDIDYDGDEVTIRCEVKNSKVH
jgi:hypothetical protein